MIRSAAEVAAAVVAAALAVAGCGGSDAAKAPTEDPGAVMRTVVRSELSGHRERSYKLLVREQRRAVAADFYRSCAPGSTMRLADVRIGIVGVHDEVFSVPGLGKTPTKAVHYRIVVQGGGAPIDDTGHLIAQEGHWRWTLSAASFSSFRQGYCP